MCVLVDSHVQLSETPRTTACQAPLSKWFPRKEYWNGLPFPSPGDLPNTGVTHTHLPVMAGGSLPLCHLGEYENGWNFKRSSFNRAQGSWPLKTEHIVKKPVSAPLGTWGGRCQGWGAAFSGLEKRTDVPVITVAILICFSAKPGDAKAHQSF